jgi:hypothetical protein
MDAATAAFGTWGEKMAEEDPALVPTTHEMAVHVDNYERFTRMMKWGAITCLIVGLIVLLILK